MRKYRNAWFINFAGIGNGVVIAPLLSCFEKTYPDIGYFHTENQVLSDEWFIGLAGLKNMKEFSPLAWRRFNKEYWPIIIDFTRKNDIDLIVNLRNEGPKFDTGYYAFKQSAVEDKNLDVSFWDLDFDAIENRTIQQNLTRDILNMFQKNGVDTSGYNPRWLSVVRENGAGFSSGVGTCTAASQRNKRWPSAKWSALGKRILTESDEKICLFSGTSTEETQQSHNIVRELEERRCELIHDLSLREVTKCMGGLRCLVSNDTGFLHISCAIGIPSVGLYTSTNPTIWSPYDKTNFTAYANSFMRSCRDRKIHCGNCFHYYDSCPAIEEYGDDIDPDKIFETVQSIVSGN